MIPLHLDRESDKRYAIVAGVGYIASFVAELLGTFFKFGFYIENGNIHSGFNVFLVGYVFFIGILIFMLLLYRNRLPKPILTGVIGAYAVAVMMMGVQG